MYCSRCGDNLAVNGLLCGICRREADARPRFKAYQRQEKVPENDYWKIAQNLLYPAKEYADLVKHDRFRVTELARRLAGIPYHRAPPELDAEILGILDALHNPPPQVDDYDQYLLDL